MMHIVFPASAPTWIIAVSVLGPGVISLTYGVARLARIILPSTSAERLTWWKYFWQARRDLRHDRWMHREQRWARRHGRLWLAEANTHGTHATLLTRSNEGVACDVPRSKEDPNA